MSTATSGARLIGGATGSGNALLLSLPAGALEGGERQILVRVGRGGMLIGEGELRYQLERKDAHRLAGKPKLLDVLADLEDRGLLDERELCFRLTGHGRSQLAELTSNGGED
ncbi:MAG: hypothetical protein QOD83_3697 [Solirubrobacteraceae bacterium]|jgi:hypothetical protein|nr:hypothetical protein [Solirubrobacteraceae bacterium]